MFDYPAWVRDLEVEISDERVAEWVTSAAVHAYLNDRGYVPSPARPGDDRLYWMTESELEMLAASSALSLGRPRQALSSFDAALRKGHSPESFPRDHAIYLIRVARAHLLDREVEQACDIATQAFTLSRGFRSERVRSDLARLGTALVRHRSCRAVQEFIDLCGTAEPVIPMA
jgi:hypothetical protein